MPSTVRQNSSIRAIGFALPALVVYLLQMFEVLGSSVAFFVMTLLLQIYVVREAMVIRAIHPQRWLLNPAVFCAFLTFSLAYGFTNFLFLLPLEIRGALGLSAEISPGMVKLESLALVAAIFMFQGYWSTFAEQAAGDRAVQRSRAVILRGLEAPRPAAIIILIALSTLTRFYTISLGLYGYGAATSAERVSETSSYSQFLSLANGAGMLALALAALFYYSARRSSASMALLATSMAVELLFGLLSGMKAALVMPFVVPIICSYIARGKVSKAWFGYVVGAIVLAYAIVEPYRAVRSDEAGELTSSGAIVELLLTDTQKDLQASQISVIWRILARGNVTYIGSLGVDYADANDELSSTAPAFLEDIFLAPAHAIIPRAIWTSKPLGELGFWYTQEVMGVQIFSSTGMGPLTYLYFAGGGIAVAAFFFLLGILQRWLWFMLQPWASLSGAVIFLSLLTIVSIVDSSVNGVIINFVRMFPLMIVLSRLLFRKVGNPEYTSLRANYV